MKIDQRLPWLTIVLVFLGACAAPTSTATTTSTSTSAGDASEETEAETTTTTDDASDTVRTIELNVSDPPSYDSGSGISLSIDDVRVGDLTSVPPDLQEDLEFALEDPDSQSLLILTITVQNQGDAPVSFFPDQGTALIGSEQVTASFLLSESFTGGGGTILDGASVTEDVYFELPQSADDVADLGEARYTVDGPFDEETFESVGPDVDLTVTWTR